MHKLLLDDLTTPDLKIARRVADKFDRTVDSSTVSRRRKKLGLPTATEAKKRGMGPLSPSERKKLARLLDGMVVPEILDLDRHGPVDQDGVVTIGTRTAGDLRIYVQNGTPYWCWFPDEDWNWIRDRVFSRLGDSDKDAFEDSLLNIQQQMLEYIAHATKHQARALSAGEATIERVVKARRQGDKPIGLPDGNDVIKIEQLAAAISIEVDEFQSRVKSSSGI